MNSPVLAYNSATGDFAVVSEELAVSMMTVGNTQNLNRVARTLKPQRVVIRWIRSGQTAVDIELIGMKLSHVCGRVEAKKIAALLHEWTGCLTVNIRDTGREVVVFPSKV